MSCRSFPAAGRRDEERDFSRAVLGNRATACESTIGRERERAHKQVTIDSEEPGGTPATPSNDDRLVRRAESRSSTSHASRPA